MALQKRAVVSSFIFKFPDGNTNGPKGRNLAWHSSNEATKHHLAPISGSIDPSDPSDPSPLATAYRELSEETGLSASSLRLYRKGKPFTFSDVAVNREWTVHPFAFTLSPADDDASIKTDWEHSSWEWHDPDSIVKSPYIDPPEQQRQDVNGTPTVPRLRESLRRVYFEAEMNPRAGKALATGLERLRTDRASGSRELTAMALGIFREVAMQMRDDMESGDVGWWDTLRMAAWHIAKNGRESMGSATTNALVAVLADMEDVVENRNGCSPEKQWDRLLGVVDHHLETRKEMTPRIAGMFATYLRENLGKRDRMTILTLSASSTIRDCIVDAYASVDIGTLELRILESRPLFEGVSIASSLFSRFKEQFDASTGRKLEMAIYTDAAAAVAAKDVDILLLGADRISANGGVSNKTGSLPAVLSAKHVSPGVRVLVLSELEKVAEPGSEGDQLEENDAGEIVSCWRNGGVKGLKVLEDSIENRGKADGNANATVRVNNVYFEWVPPSLVHAFICEEGILDNVSIREKSTKIGLEMERLLGNL